MTQVDVMIEAEEAGRQAAIDGTPRECPEQFAVPAVGVSYWWYKGYDDAKTQSDSGEVATAEIPE